MNLPELKLVNPNRKQKLKILLLSDDLRMHSGIATMSREFVMGTAHKYDWVQLGAALQHPDHGKVFDVSQEINKYAGIDDANVRIFAHTGYGNPEVLRELYAIEKFDAILHFTDPRFWGWLYNMEHEIRSILQIPIMYLNIWDCPPAPHWNLGAYSSCDLIMNISKQTHALVKMVLGEGNYIDLETTQASSGRLVSIVPHGINSDYFFPIVEGGKDFAEFTKIRDDFFKMNDVDFVIYWNNRNIRRKMMGDLLLAYKRFCDKLPIEKAKRCALLMHTQMVDENGTDIPAVVRAVCPDYKVIFNEERLPTHIMNMFYNMSDITINISSNEGWGLSSSESVMAGTPIIVNVTGGMQDQVRFEDDNGNMLHYDENFTSNHAGTYKKHGNWAKVVFPSNRSLQGSPMTPYIFDDRADFDDVAEKILEWYNTPKEIRKQYGLEGRQWFLSEESGLNHKAMCAKMEASIDACIANFKIPKRFDIFKIEDRKKITNAGIVYND